LARAARDKVVISIHEGYDEYDGTFKRIFIDLVSERRTEIDLRYWDFGEIIGFCKIFLKDAGTNTDGETWRSYIMT